MNESDGTVNVAMEVELPHPPAKVWRALTDPSLVSKWLMKTDLVAEKGRRFRFTRDIPQTPMWDGIVDCEVLELEAQKRLQYTWKTKGEIAVDTVVTWTLTPTPKGTRLALLHSGFQASNKAASGGARVGWNQMLNTSLPKVLEEA